MKYDHCCYKKRDFWTRRRRHTERKRPHDDRSRDRSDTSMSMNAEECRQPPEVRERVGRLLF